MMAFVMIDPAPSLELIEIVRLGFVDVLPGSFYSHPMPP